MFWIGLLVGVGVGFYGGVVALAVFMHSADRSRYQRSVLNTLRSKHEDS